MKRLTIIFERIKMKMKDVFACKNTSKLESDLTVFLKKQCGAVTVLTALAFPVLLGFMGIAVDVGNLYVQKARLQNATDAAALAGGALYKYPPKVDGQEKLQGTDAKQGKRIIYANNHAEADAAARNYIIRNLGDDVTVDEVSALSSNPTTTTSGNTTTERADVYYRVIASKTVPLYFLPVISSARSQVVRTASVAIAETARTTEHGSGSGGGATTITHTSVFDNLFTYSEYFDSGLSNENFKMNAVYVGDMVFTYGNGAGTQAAYYDIVKIMGGQTQSVDHLFSDNADAYTILTTLRNNSGGATNAQWAAVNDPIIDTFFNTTSYVDAFVSKLNEPHYDSHNQTLTITGNVTSNSTCKGPSNASTSTNVIHVSSKFQQNVPNLVLNMVGSISGDPDTPIYVIVDANITHPQLNVKNNTRPLIFIYLGTNNILINNNANTDFAKLTIYAPYGTVGITPDNEQINFTGTYYGNIIARRIAIQASGGGGKWIQQNFLENSNGYTDTAIANISQEVADFIASKSLPDNIKADALQRYASSLGKNVSDLSDPLFYSKLGYNDKQKLYNIWKQLQLAYPDFANYLWPWNSHFGIHVENGEDVVTNNSVLRIINPRTESNPYFNSESGI